jgi:cyclic beta-1,2-glucan glucanotransferase
LEQTSETSPKVAAPEAESVQRAADTVFLRDQGRRTARALEPARMSREDRAAFDRRLRSVSSAIGRALRNASRQDPDARWLLDNPRLLVAAARSIRDLGDSLRKHPAAIRGSASVPRTCAIAGRFLDAAQDCFTEAGLLAFVEGFERVEVLRMGELWALQPVIEFVLLERLAEAVEGEHADSIPALVTSLRRLNECVWKDLFERMNRLEVVLAKDPAGAYASMDYESRDLYRNVITDCAEHSGKSEMEVAETAVALAAQAREGRDLADRAVVRRAHIGYYLIDAGLDALRAAIAYRPPMKQRIRAFLDVYAAAFYLIGIELATLAIVYGLLGQFRAGLGALFAGFFLLILPSTQAAVDFMNNLVTSLLAPRVLAKLDFSKGIPDEYATMVAVPALLLNEAQVRSLAMDLEIRYLANRDPNLFFALLTDSPDSERPVEEPDGLAEIGRRIIDDLNLRYGRGGRTPFLLLHRHRVFNESEGRWMGWERKRGKLLDLNRLLRGRFDSFPVKAGDLRTLPPIRYVITVDSDTQLPRDSAQRLIGAIAHPLNRAVIDPATQMVVEGYGILQPRIGISIQSASRSRLANLYSGQTGFDIYTRAISDVYQDLFGEAIFTGKGIYEVDVVRWSLESRFPDNALLSHDLIEGAFARVGLVSDIELIDDYPSHFSAYSRRNHRWMRGDWQLLRWLFGRVPIHGWRFVPNPMSVISRWKILDNLRRSLYYPATLALLLFGWFYLPGPAWFWTVVTIAMLLMPAYSDLLFSVIRAPWGAPGWRGWAKDTVSAFARAHLVVLLQLVFLLHGALLALDASLRSLARVFLTKKKLLEWETAAQAEAAARKKATADLFLDWSWWIAAFLGLAVWRIRPAALPVALPILAAWFFSRGISAWLGRSPKNSQVGLDASDVSLLRQSGLRTWRFFREWSSQENNWLIPDNVRQGGVVADRVSPTNLGFLLNARIAAVRLGYLTLPEFIEQTLLTLDAALKMPRYRGHFLNWYSAERLEPLDPKFVSTVDSGNLAGCLWTLKQAALAFAREAPEPDALWTGISGIAELIGESGDGPAVAFRERILRSRPHWKQALPELEEIALRFAEQNSGETHWWAGEIHTRIARAREWLAATADLCPDLEHIATIAGELVDEMDFGFLYQARKKALSVGFDTSAGRLEPSSYDLLASESRMAAFVAIAKGDVPQECWFALGRKHTIAYGERCLVSWTGTMFEYLMPAIWMRHYPGTIMYQSMQSAVRVQRKTGDRKGVPWGISESGSCAGDPACEYGYAAFGIPELAMKQGDRDTLVVSPYSTCLALLVDPRAAIRNLRRMIALGWRGAYGFFEAADYSRGGAQTVESWMAHHQGMALLAICNVLFEKPLEAYFHAEPYVQATELLLHERVPTAVTVELEGLPAMA